MPDVVIAVILIIYICFENILKAVDRALTDEQLASALFAITIGIGILLLGYAVGINR